MDDVDRAQLAEEQYLAAALERAASLARQVLGHHPTSTQCVACGSPIEAVRQAYGFACCAACARAAEHFQEHGR